MGTQRPARSAEQQSSPFRHGATRRSASGPTRAASPRDVAIYFREDCRGLRDSLQLEMVVAQYCLRIRDVRTTSGVPAGDVIGASVVLELEAERDPLSLAILRGLADVGAGQIASRAAEAALRLTDRGIGLPEQFADVGKAVPTGAWRARGEAGEYAFFAGFEHPRGGRHTLALFVEPRPGEVVKHLGLLGPMDQVDPGGPFDPARLETVDLPVAGALMRDVLERSYGVDADRTDDFRALIATARASNAFRRLG